MKNRHGTAMMITIFFTVILVSSMLIIMSNIVETNIRYTKANNSTILMVIEDRNKNEQILTDIYKIVNTPKKNNEIIADLRSYKNFGLEYKAGPIAINNNKIKIVFTDKERDYTFLIEDKYNIKNVYRIY